MKTFAHYLSYRLEQSILRTVVFTVLSVLLAQNVIQSSIRREEFPETGLYILAVLLSIFCAIVPMLEMAPLKKRRHLDVLFSCPISRNQVAIAHFLSGFIQVFVIYSVTFGVACSSWLTKADLFDLSYLVPYYVLSLCVGLIMYSFFIFFLKQFFLLVRVKRRMNKNQ